MKTRRTPGFCAVKEPADNLPAGFIICARRLSKALVFRGRELFDLFDRFFCTLNQIAANRAKQGHDGRSDVGVKRPGRRIVFMAMSSTRNLGHLK